MPAPRSRPPLGPFLRPLGRALPVLLMMVGGGCASSDSVRSAQHSFDRALRREPPTAFFGPLLARAQGEATSPALTADARQHYLSIIAFLEAITPRGEEQLRRDGLLGEAYVLKALAQWRLGRLDVAAQSAAKARASGQEALDERERSLFRALEGVLKVESALAALAAGEPYERAFTLIAGPDGAWRALGEARTEAGRGSAINSELLQTRLAAFKVVKDARDRLGPAASGGTLAAAEDWSRLRADAQIELAEFAALPVPDPAAHSLLVRRWQLLCGLEAPVR